MRSLLIASSVFGLLPLSAPAQDFIGTVGACMIETVDGVPFDIAPCRRLPEECTPVDCAVPFVWADRRSRVTLTTGAAGLPVSEATEFEGVPASAPDALRQSDPRDCTYADGPGMVFCFIEGVEAQALAVDGPGARDSLIGSVNTRDLVAGFHGTYTRQDPQNCGEFGMSDGIMAIEGDLIQWIESDCQLTDGVSVGDHGAVLFAGWCSGEGENWQEEFLLKLDDYGNLAVLRSDYNDVWSRCGG